MTNSTNGGPSFTSRASPAANILLVEDDPGVAWTIKDMLGSEGYEVRHVDNGAQARVALESLSPDLVILDLMLPDADGLVLCADIKSRISVPIIICSATNRKRDTVLALKLGADDFIAKPFDVDEFLTRVAAALRRARTAQNAMVGSIAARTDRAIDSSAARSRDVDLKAARTVDSRGASAPALSVLGPLSLEHARRRVTFAGDEIQLTPTEYRLLSCFLSRPDEVLSRQELAKVVWGYEDASIGRSIDVHVHRLRAKLQATQETRGVPGPTVVSVRGFGYKLLREVVSEAA